VADGFFGGLEFMGSTPWGKRTPAERMASIAQDWCSERRRLLRYSGEEMKHQIVHALQKYVLNPAD
jgi:hypothetical protein